VVGKGDSDRRGRSIATRVDGHWCSLAKRLHGRIVLPTTFEVPVYWSRTMSRNSQRIEEDDQGGANLVASNQVYRGVRQSVQRLPRSADIGPMMHSYPFIASL
jgi:hypothetical protein